MENEVKITARVPESLRNELKIRAIEEGINLQELVARALKQYLGQGTAPKRRKPKRK